MINIGNMMSCWYVISLEEYLALGKRMIYIYIYFYVFIFKLYEKYKILFTFSIGMTILFLFPVSPKVEYFDFSLKLAW